MLGRLFDQHLPAWVAVMVGFTAVAGILFAVGRVWIGVGVAAAFALLTLGLAAYRRWRLLEDLLEFRPLVKRRITARRFGAKPSPVAQKRFVGQEPPYIERDEIDEELSDALKRHRIVVVKGVANAGKTRAVFEAIGRVLPRHRIVVPSLPADGPDPLAEVLEKHWLIPRWRRRQYVLVIHDVQNRLGALQQHDLRRWLRKHPRARVVATLSAEWLADRLNEARTPINNAGTEFLGRAEQVSVDDEFSGKALREAHKLYNLPEGQSRLGAFLASAEPILVAYETSATVAPAARALALSAINCERAGLAKPIALSKLIEMAHRVSAADGQPLRDDEWEGAAEYCTRDYDGVPGILVRSAAHGFDDRHFTANSVLVELVDGAGKRRGARPAELPEHVWRAVIEVVAEDPNDLLAVAAAAERRGRPDLAWEVIGQAAEDSGSAAEIAESLLESRHREDDPLFLTELLDRASQGSDPGTRELPREAPSGPPPEGDPVFDPTIYRAGRWREFYRERVWLRDTVRFTVLFLCDMAGVGGGILLAEKLGTVALNSGSSVPTIVGTSASLVFIFFLFFGLYRADRDRARLGEIIKGTSLAAASLALLAFWNGYNLSKLPVVAAATGLAILVVFVLRRAYDETSRRWVKREKLESRTILITARGPTEMAVLIKRACRRPMQFLGYLATKASDDGWLGPVDQLNLVAREVQADRVIIADAELSAEDRLALIYRCHAKDIETEVVPSGAELFQGASDALDDTVVPLIQVRPLYLTDVDNWTKRAFDLIFLIPIGLIALLLLAPIALAMKLCNRDEPLLMNERRYGLGEFRFKMWRLRTTSGGSLTRLGRVLTRLRLNELPQLINVLTGDMSLVGPRPISDDDFARLDEYQRARYAVRPGITGLWQIARRNRTTFDDVTNLDIVYCRSWTPLLDFTILLRTFWAVSKAPAPEWVKAS